jgi:hypothetical protein
MWILTASANDYNQHGKYFIAAFRKKPTRERLSAALNNEYTDEAIDKLLETGGGREGTEDWWHELFEYSEPTP